jgi:hypothetical protein
MAASRFRDQVAAREQVSGSIPLRARGAKVKVGLQHIPVVAQYLAKFEQIEN